MWELLLSALLALEVLPPRRHGTVASAAGVLGLGLIGFAVFTFNGSTPFPGWAALAPCGGAALVIYSGVPANPIQRALSLRLAVFVGLISFSLYLWHWPILVLASYVMPSGISSGTTAALIAMSFF